MRILMIVHLYRRNEDEGNDFHYERSALVNAYVDARRADQIAVGLIDRLNHPIIAVTVRPFDADMSEVFDRLVEELELPDDFQSSNYQLRPMSIQING